MKAKLFENGIVNWIQTAMRAWRAITKIIIVGFLAAGFIINNLWRWMPEFHLLDAVSSFSIYLQFSVLVIAVFALFLRVRDQQLIRGGSVGARVFGFRCHLALGSSF